MQSVDLQRPCVKSRWGVVCMWLLVASGACSSSGIDNTANEFHGARTVSFDKNGGDTEAVPASKTILPPETTLGNLPKEPTRAGHRFAGWNRERDGSGEPFTASTPLPAILTIVYAQWERSLGLHLSRDTLTLTPMVDGEYEERSPAFAVTVSGFKNAEDASKATLEAHATSGNESSWFSWQSEHGPYAEGVQTFVFSFVYHGTGFLEGPATLNIQLKDIPLGYEYDKGPRTLRVATANGEKDGRPIPLHPGNVEHFNRYANTEDGRKRHYQLVENVTLPKPEAGKSNWTPLGAYVDASNNRPFSGSLDGGGYSIVGLVLDNVLADYQGLFGYIGEGAHVKNLGLKNVSVHGRQHVGGLAGRSEATVQNCHATGHVSGTEFVGGLVGLNGATVQNSHAASHVNGTESVGGLVGQNKAAVQNGYATGHVSGTQSVGGLVGRNESRVQSSHATGDVDGQNEVGGVVGQNNGTLLDSRATGHVSGTQVVGGVAGINKLSKTVQNSHATGHVSGEVSVGGLVGVNEGGSVQDSHATGDVNGHTYVGGLVGMSMGVGGIAPVYNSYATGHVNGTESVGGLMGYRAGGAVFRSYATGKVIGTSRVGGLVGYSAYLGSVHNSYATGDVEGQHQVGGLVGENAYPLRDSYATGSVSGENWVGGLVGKHSSPRKEEVQNAVALNPRVVASDGDAKVGRIVGESSQNGLKNNHARDDMALTHSPSADTLGPDLEDGAEVSAAHCTEEAFWKDTLFFDETLWEWGLAQLPTLKDVGGDQNPTLQPN